MPLHSKRSLYEKLHNPKYRESFVSSRLSQIIATQARILRQKKQMSQKDLARELGTSQNAIYRLENPKYGRPNISTLKKFADYFAVGLVVRFAPFSELVDWTLNMSPESMDVPSFADDLGFIERKEPELATASEPAVHIASDTAMADVRSQAVQQTDTKVVMFPIRDTGGIRYEHSA